VLAGGPAIIGAWIGALAFNGSVVAFLLGLGAGAIVQVIVQLSPSIRNESGRYLYPQSVAGLIAGIGILYVTSLLVA
jgi:zinc transporter, ZIP family